MSAVTQYVNDKGEAIKVVVDSAKPCINLNVTAGGLAYNGEKDNWTNQDILFELSFEQDSCPYAGLHQYEYVYEKLGMPSIRTVHRNRRNFCRRGQY